MVKFAGGGLRLKIKMSNRNKRSQCTICKGWMRSDHLERHMKTHQDILDLPDDQLEEELRSRHEDELAKEVKRQRVVNTAKDLGLSVPEEVKESESLDKDDLRELLSRNNHLYLEQIELGKNISSILDEGVVREESLTKEHKHALDIFRRQESRCDISAMHLRPWQEEALKLFNVPSERQVIWIVGCQGYEGKSWFQNYVEAYFGYQRVARIDLRIKHANVCNVLKKRTLATVDIFLFNDSRSVSGEEINLYRILEDIKDGQATASKYNNDTLRFKIPNTVMVFSNGYPKIKKLSRDRWRIYNANKDRLREVTAEVMKIRKDGYNPQNIDHRRKYD